MKKCKKCGEEKELLEFYLVTGSTIKYRPVCKKCTVASKVRRQKIPFTAEWYHRRYERLKKGAVERGKEFLLTLNDCKALWHQELCYYCELPAATKTIDRVDNSKGYSKDNCVMACWNCNQRKRNLLFSEIKMFYEKITAFTK